MGQTGGYRTPRRVGDDIVYAGGGVANQALRRFQAGFSVTVIVRRCVDLPGQRKEQDQPYGGSTDAVSEPSKHH